MTINIWDFQKCRRGSKSAVPKVPLEVQSCQKCRKSAVAFIDKNQGISQSTTAALPYLENGCELIIPVDAPDKYRWWTGGQSVLDTLLEIDAPDSVIEHYVCELQQPDMWKRWQKILEKRIAARPVAGHAE